jgi:hypothetical protein
MNTRRQAVGAVAVAVAETFHWIADASSAHHSQSVTAVAATRFGV